MAKIILHRAAVDNGGRYRDAGEVLTIGDDADQIRAADAAALKDSNGAVSFTESKVAAD